MRPSQVLISLDCDSLKTVAAGDKPDERWEVPYLAMYNAHFFFSAKFVKEKSGCAIIPG